MENNPALAAGLSLDFTVWPQISERLGYHCTRSEQHQANINWLGTSVLNIPASGLVRRRPNALQVLYDLSTALLSVDCGRKHQPKEGNSKQEFIHDGLRRVQVDAFHGDVSFSESVSARSQPDMGNRMRRGARILGRPERTVLAALFTRYRSEERRVGTEGRSRG